MPGFFNVGGAAGFVPYFREDKIHLGKIQMKSELITIQLYRGYAVVKGEYFMYNHDKKKISMKIGYPINGTIYNNDVNAVVFEDLYNFEVKTGDKKMPVSLFRVDSIQESYRSKHLVDIKNWYVWQGEFEPESITKITVYFIVNTSQSFIRKGYDKKEADGFCYVLESGAAWKDKIEKGRIFIELKDNLEKKDILATIPNNIFKIEGKQMIFDFQNLEPIPADNIVIRVTDSKNMDKNDFEKITKNAQKLFENIDKINANDIKLKNTENIDTKNFHINSSPQSLLANFLMFLAVYGLPLFMTAIGLTIGFNTLFKKKKS
ncbi:MAG: hypothetical protein EAZ85_08655 [Bacteroidetes bacterium]|nr:MAG: hypothetical protein EAZ85_08655 [Bacteroidota bacterium]TAG87460.1 MAG: hypothetical protein EAZ20_10560 [Bacteroidota bacterium]